MQQAIPYRSWQPLITHSSTNTHFTITTSNLTHRIGLSPKEDTCLSSNDNNTIPFFVSPKMVRNMVLENAVMVFSRRGCCMSHVVNRLLLGLGVNPAVHELDEKEELAVVRELEAIVGANDSNHATTLQFPAIFIGGKLFGGLDRVMATHISGELIPILKEARALWL